MQYVIYPLHSYRMHHCQFLLPASRCHEHHRQFQLNNYCVWYRKYKRYDIIRSSGFLMWNQLKKYLQEIILIWSIYVNYMCLIFMLFSYVLHINYIIKLNKRQYKLKKILKFSFKIIYLFAYDMKIFIFDVIFSC